MESGEMCLVDLPPEIFYHLCGWLGYGDVIRLGRCCSHTLTERMAPSVQRVESAVTRLQRAWRTRKQRQRDGIYPHPVAWDCKWMQRNVPCSVARMNTLHMDYRGALLCVSPQNHLTRCLIGFVIDFGSLRAKSEVEVGIMFGLDVLCKTELRGWEGRKTLYLPRPMPFALFPYQMPILSLYYSRGCADASLASIHVEAIVAEAPPKIVAEVQGLRCTDGFLYYSDGVANGGLVHSSTFYVDAETGVCKRREGVEALTERNYPLPNGWTASPTQDWQDDVVWLPSLLT